MIVMGGKKFTDVFAYAWFIVNEQGREAAGLEPLPLPPELVLRVLEPEPDPEVPQLRANRHVPRIPNIQVSYKEFWNEDRNKFLIERYSEAAQNREIVKLAKMMGCPHMILRKQAVRLGLASWNHPDAALRLRVEKMLASGTTQWGQWRRLAEEMRVSVETVRKYVSYVKGQMHAAA